MVTRIINLPKTVFDSRLVSKALNMYFIRFSIGIKELKFNGNDVK